MPAGGVQAGGALDDLSAVVAAGLRHGQQGGGTAGFRELSGFAASRGTKPLDLHDLGALGQVHVVSLHPGLRVSTAMSKHRCAPRAVPPTARQHDITRVRQERDHIKRQEFSRRRVKLDLGETACLVQPEKFNLAPSAHRSRGADSNRFARFAQVRSYLPWWPVRAQGAAGRLGESSGGAEGEAPHRLRRS